MAEHLQGSSNVADQRRQFVIDTIPAQVWVAAPDGAITYVNQQRLDYTGSTLEAALGWGWRDIFHSDDLPGLVAAWRLALAAEQALEAEARVRRFDGAYRWFLIRAVPCRDEQGVLVEWLGTNTDIDDRKRVELQLQHTTEQLRRSEQEYRSIVDAIPQLIAALGEDGRVLYVNAAWLAFTGMAADQVADAADLFHPDDRARVDDERRRGLRSGTAFESEARLRRADGVYRWFLIHYRPVADDARRVVRWYATGTDIDQRHREEERVRNENVALREEVDRTSMFEEIVGTSAAVKAILRQVEQVARTESTVLITGETGTGKELLARAIHRRSGRAAKAFITVNCAAIPASLIASELFGHERGAFTGALQRRQGKFELADGGTIFLDEVGELALDTQMALLRVLQEREVERVGGDRPIKVDVRVIAATNRDLTSAVADRTFRADLFYRLNVFPMEMPALRERPGDIPLLVQYFAHRLGRRTGRTVTEIAGRSLALLQSYPWPGNIRELQNVIERAVVVMEATTLTVDERWLVGAPPTMPMPGAAHLGDDLAAHERVRVEAALAEAAGRVAGRSGAAARLGIPRSTLESKIRALGIDKHRFKSTTLR
ncbi:MAG TPA: sigma 54-interacting transcriptional regulator [Luteitalea sp.]|nr:sigma 54-interacting transcriptional regulator [Luteitalea sp.]